MKNILCAVAALCLSVSAAETAVLDGFGDPSKFELNPGMAEISRDGKIMKADTAGNTDTWNWLFRTRPGLLKSQTDYIAVLNYRVEKPLRNSQFFLILSRPYSAGHSRLDTMTNSVGETDRFKRATFRFRTGDMADYSFQIHAHNRLKGEITALTLKEVPDTKRFLPAAVGAAPYSGQFPLLPTGAKEFEVLLPDNPDGVIVKAADFGFCPEAADNVDALNRAIEFCKRNNAARLELAPGVYRMTAERSVLLRELRNFELDGKGALLIFHKTGQAPNFLVERCERVALRNFNFDWDWTKAPLASIVKVAETGPDYVDFEFVDYKDFPDKTARVSLLHSYNPVTASLSTEGGSSHDTFEFAPNARRLKRQWISGNLMRLYSSRRGLVSGQYFRMQHRYYDANGMNLNGNRHLTLEDINIYSCAGHAFRVDGAQRYWQLRRVNIVPPENVAARPVSCSADHFHIARSCGFMKLEECEFGHGGDDCLNIHDCSAFVMKSGVRSVRICRGANLVGYREGAEIELRNDDYSPTGFRSRIAAVRSVNGVMELVLQDPLPDGIGDHKGFVLFNWAFNSHNFIIRNNFFHDNRVRGLLLQGRDITVENNRFRNQAFGSINIVTGYTYHRWSEGYGASNIVVRNNTFEAANICGVKTDGMERDIHIGTYQGIDPSSRRTDYPILSDILVEGNTFTDTFGLTAFISSAGNVTFRNNTFINMTPRRQKQPYRAGFYVTNSRNVAVVNNRYITSPHVPNPGVTYDSASVQNLTVTGNTVVPAR